MIGGAALGRLRIIIGGDADDLDKLLNATGKKIAAFGAGVFKTRTLVAALGITAAAAGLGALFHSSMETIDAQSKLAHRVQATVESIQTLKYAADLAGVSGEELASVAGKINQRLAEAARTGAGPAYEALRRLGLTANDLLKLDMSERLAVIADRMQELGYTTAQQADVLRQFGVRSQDMISLFEGGGKAIRDARDDVRSFGVAVSQIDAVKVEQANDAWTTARLIITGVANQLAVTLAPIIKDVAERLANAARESGGFGELIRSAVRSVVTAFGSVLAAIHDIRVAWAQFTSFFRTSLTENVLNGMRLAAMLVTKQWIPPLVAVRDRAAEIKDQLGERPDPEAWGRWFDEITKRANASAKAVADSRDKMLGKRGPELDPFSEDQRKKLEEKLANLRKSIATEDMALREQRDKELRDLQELEQKKIATREAAAAMRLQIEDKHTKALNDLIQSRLEEGILTEDEILARKYAKQLEDLAAFERNRSLTTERAAALRTKLEQQNTIEQLGIATRGYADFAGRVDAAMLAISQVIGQEGQKQFGVMKAIATATALVKGIESVVSSYAAGAKIGGPIVGAAFAGVAAAATAAQIAALHAVQPGSGAASPTAPTAAAPAAAAASGGGEPQGGGQVAAGQTLFISGINPRQMFSGKAMRELAEAMIEYQRNGGTIVLADR